MTSSGVSDKGKFIILLLKERVLITGGVACFPLFLLQRSCIITERKGLYGTRTGIKLYYLLKGKDYL